MANRKLGIDVEIKYPSATQIKEVINSAWQKQKDGYELKVNVAADKNSLARLRKTITNYFDGTKWDMELKINTTKVSAEITDIKKQVRQLHEMFDKEFELKVGGLSKGGGLSKELEEINKATKGASKEREKADKNQTQSLREIVSIQKEVNKLKQQSIGKSEEEQKVYSKRITALTSQMNDLKSQHNSKFNTVVDDQEIMKSVDALGKFNIELKETQQSQKETQQGFKEYISLINEEYRLQKQLQTAGEGQSAVIREQLDMVNRKMSATKEEFALEERMNAEQRSSVNFLREENELQLRSIATKREDAALAKQQKEVYNELKRDLKEIHKLNMQIADLQAKADREIITGKERDKLTSLEQEVMVRKNMYDESIRGEKMLSQEGRESLEALRKQQSAKEELASETAKMNADLAKTNQAYDEIYASISRIKSLNDRMASAGDREVAVIKEAIVQENRLQQEIREKYQLSERANNEREEEIALIKRAQREQSELNADIAAARQGDQYRQNSMIGMLDPMTVYNNVKQAGMEIYQIVADLDTHIVDIEKVADASEAEMNAFKANVFDFASDVGKSADEYAVSVERWVTTGLNLADGVKMARESTIGAFVGNIDESAMVDYMSVPLVAYKNTALEASDVLNVMNEVANNNAIEMDDLGQAYKRAAGTASTAGTSFAEFTGMVSGAQEATRQGGEKVGTAFRTFDINFSKIASKLSKSDVTKFGFFRDIGVNLSDSNGNLRSTYDIIGDLVGVWDNLNSKERSTATFYAAGKNHANILQGLMDNWGGVTKAVGEAEGQMALFDKKSGSAYEEFEKQQNSVEFAVASLKNAWSEFIHTISGGRDGVVLIVQELTKILEVGQKLAENEALMKFAGMFLKATLWATAAVAVNKFYTTLSGGLSSIFAPLQKVFGITAEAGAAGTGFASSVGKIATSFGKILPWAIKLAPALAAVGGALWLMDEAGVDVVGMFKDLGAGKYSPTRVSSQVTNAIDEMVKSQERLGESRALFGQAEQGEILVNSLEEALAKKEELAKEKGVNVVFSQEEFQKLSTQFNDLSETMGFDIKLSFNSYEEIKSKIDELNKLIEETKQESINEIVKETIKQERSAVDNPSSYNGAVEGYAKQQQSEFDRTIGSSGVQSAASQARRKELEDLNAMFKEYTNTADFKAASEARKKSIEGHSESVQVLIDTMDDLNIASLDEGGAMTISSKLGSGIPELNKTSKAYSALVKSLESGENITREQMATLEALDPTLAGITNLTKEWDDTERERVINLIKGEQESTDATKLAVQEKIKAILEHAGAGDLYEDYMNKLNGSGVSLINMFSEMGEHGLNALGVTSEFLARHGDNWSSVLSTMQVDMDSLDREIITKYGLETDIGTVDVEIVETLMGLPDEIKTRFKLVDENGVPKIKNMIDWIEQIPEETLSQLGVEIGDNDEVVIDSLIEKIGEVPDVTEMILDGDFTGLDEAINHAETELNYLDIHGKATPKIDADKEKFNTGIELTYGDLGTLNNETATPKVDLDPTNWNSHHTKIKTEADNMDGRTITVWASIKQVGKSIGDWFSGLGKSKSVGIDPNIGRSFSAGIGEQANILSSTSQATTTRRTTRDDAPPAKVNTDVWRYWAKELFKGIPLENSMDKLDKQISNANDNQAQLISLYKQQIRLLDQQIAYEKDMQKAQQSEMNSVLNQLRRQGFRTSGNQVTNLGITKNMSGDKAEKAQSLLDQWKSLYESLDSTADRIRNLGQDKLNANTSIKDAQEAQRLEKIAKELEKIEGILTKTTSLITAISNDLSIHSSKLGFVGGEDYELRMGVTEEGINKSAANVRTLANEFNKLSTMYVENSENAEEVLSQLETLKSEILGNADAVIEYQQALKDLEIDRAVGDFDKFSAVLEGNIGRVASTIDSLREGLVSGTGLGGLSNMIGLDFTRKTALEREYEQRLELEDKLNKALEGYAKKNVDRAKGVANATLQIEAKKYQALLDIKDSYTNGKVANITLSSPSGGIGLTGAGSKNGEYQQWLNSMVGINNHYTVAYNAMVSKYDQAMSKAQTRAEREMLTNDMIISQLELQESLYQSMIETNNRAIQRAQIMLKDTSLTTEQRQILMDAIREYEEANIGAQDGIKEAISGRFELEKELMDEAITKTQEYTSRLEEMLEIAQAVNSSDEVIGSIYGQIYQGKLSEYGKITQVMKDLTAEQAKFIEGSYEWNILDGQIEDVRSQLNGLTVDLLNANKNILGSQLSQIQTSSERGALGGLTADEYKRQQETWLKGVEKELELEKLRGQLASLEDKTLQGRLELMDRQERVSKSELEYVDKQLRAQQLREKLDNIGQERNVQTLTKDASGNWQWGYVADQTEYDSTNSELKDLELEIEKYRQEQNLSYVDDMNSVLESARGGEFRTTEELQQRIASIQHSYRGVIGDGVNAYDVGAIVTAYNDYLKGNHSIIEETGMGSQFSETIANIGARFEQSFVNVSEQLGKMIGDELRNALSNSMLDRNGNPMIIEHQVLEFPNATDKNDIIAAFKSLPMIAKQISTSK